MRTIPKGTYAVQEQAQLASAFDVQAFSNTNVGKVLTPGRKTLSGKEASSHWASVTIQNAKGETILIDGLKLAKQAAADAKLKAEVFSKLEAAIVGQELKITACEFKSEFSLGYANGKFMV